ncbi:unnamed protein product, partial [Pneumocystis jirovecii]
MQSLSDICLDDNLGKKNKISSFSQPKSDPLSFKGDSGTFFHDKPHFKETLDAVTTENDDGCKMLNQYLIKQKIGKGSYGTVNWCIDTLTGKEYAIKDFSKIQLRKVHKCSRFQQPKLSSGSFLSDDFPFYRNLCNHAESDNPLYFIQKEINIMKKINHKNIVSMIEVLDDPHGDSLYMELCEKGVVMDMDVNNAISPYSENECRKWFRDLILVHAHGICHCDIKPENLLLSKDGTLKIADFGISKTFTGDNDSFCRIKGTPAFMAPELCVFDHVVSCKAADIWSMGITLWCLAFGYLPFNESDIMKLYDIIKTQ